MQRYIIWGNGGHALVLHEMISLTGSTLVALFDNNPSGTSVIDGIPLYCKESGFFEWLKTVQNPADFSGLIAIGREMGSARSDLHQFFDDHKIGGSNLVHPFASVASTALLGRRIQILAQALVGPHAEVGDACILNHKSSLDHESRLGQGVHLAPGATVCGCVDIQDNVFVGANAVILPRLSIGQNALIGAGAVVTKNVPKGAVVVGNPARIIKHVAP